MRRFLLPGLFALLLAVPLALLLLLPPRSFSENENRYLETAPDLEAKAFLEGWMTGRYPW